jgi:hypothetical protein
LIGKVKTIIRGKMKTKLEKIDWGGRNSNKGKNENDGKLLRMKMEEAYKEGKCVNEDGG